MLQGKSYILILVLFFSSYLSFSKNVDDVLNGDETLIIGYFNAPPFVIIEPDSSISGISVWLWEEIADRRNIKYKYKASTLKQVLKDLRNHKIDVSISPLTVTADRVRDMHFSHPFFVSNSTVVINQDDNSKPLQFLNAFFSYNFFKAVGALILLLLIVGISVWLFERKHNYVEFGRGVKGIFSGLWWSAVTMTTVGYGDKAPRTLGGRFVALIWMFTSIIVISGFTASITTSLTMNKVFTTQQDIKDFKTSKLGVVESSSSEEWLQREFFAEIKDYQDIETGLIKVKDNKIEGFIHSEPVVKYIISKDSTYAGLKILPIRFNLQFFSFGFSQHLDEEVEHLISEDIIEETEQLEWRILLAEYNVNQM